MSRTYAAVSILAILAVPPLAAQQAGTGTSTQIVFVQEEEQQAREQLRRILATYDLDPWIFTREVKVEAGVIPHSHPVLTVNTRYLDDDERQLSTFLHEQIHWFLSSKERKAGVTRAVDALREIYPNPPSHEEIGTRSEESTYLHFLVNWLELDALTELLGAEPARKILSEKGYYEWIYDRVLQDTAAIGAVLADAGLLITADEGLVAGD